MIDYFQLARNDEKIATLERLLINSEVLKNERFLKLESFNLDIEFSEPSVCDWASGASWTSR